MSAVAELFPWYPLAGLEYFQCGPPPEREVGIQDSAVIPYMPQMEYIAVVVKTKLLYEAGIEVEVRWQEDIAIPESIIQSMYSVGNGVLEIWQTRGTDRERLARLEQEINAAAVRLAED